MIDQLPDLVFAHSAGDTSIVVTIVLARLFIPLLFPRFPLVIVVVMLIDAADQTILATYTDVDTSESGAYQSVDKALDIYYLSIAYLSMLRNWTSDAAFRTGQFLFYYRLVGVVLFELTHERLFLLIFPNTFEYFFIAYELVRLRFDPSRISARFWLLLAACIWIFVKLPQEYWIHIAKLDFTDTLKDYPALGPAIVVALLVAALVVWRVVLPRLPATDWAWRFRPDPLPSSLSDLHARFARRLESGRVLTMEAFEKACLLALLGIIFATILPDIDATVVQIVVGVTAVVLANAAISLTAARHGGFGLESGAARYAALLAANLLLVFLGHALMSDAQAFDLGYGLFFAFLITTIVWLYDAFRPVYDQRFTGSPLQVRSPGDLLLRARERRA